MDADSFWAIISQVVDTKYPALALKEKLNEIPLEELISFQWYYDKFHNEAYTWNLWGTAYIINEGCSDDCFSDFRYGLISKGKEVYENAINDADSLAENVEITENINDESFGYSAIEIYEERTGDTIQRTYPFLKKPKGKKWKEKDLKKLLPKVWSKFGDKPEILFLIKGLEKQFIPLFSYALVWISLNNVFSPKIRKEISETVKLLRKRLIRPETVLTLFGNNVQIDDIAPKYRKFVSRIIVNDITWGDYLRLFEIEFKVKAEKDYANVPLNWEAYDRMSKHLDGRLQSWKMPGKHR